jgi:6-phosphogluconolactonase
MGDHQIARFESSDALVAAAAVEWFKELQQVRTAQYAVALSGGRIAGRLFSAIAQLPNAPELLRDVHFFWSDERCVPSSDAESNYRLAKEFLLSPLRIPASNIHRIKGELSPGAAAAEAEGEMLQQVITDGVGKPVLDLVLLGMGEDGHVASLFPGEPEEVISSPQIYRPVVGPKPPPNRITLGYGAIAAAQQVWVLVSGAGKQVALERSLEPEGKTPLARVLAVRAMTRILTDVRVT